MAIVQIFENGTQPPIVPRLPMGEYPMGMVPGVGDQFSDHFKRNWLKYLLAGGLLAGSAKRKYGKYSAASNKAALYDNTHNVLQQLHSELTDKNAKWDEKDRKAAIAQYKLILGQAAPTLASKLNNFGSDEEFLKHAPTYNAVVKNMANDYKIDAQKAGDKYNSSILGGLANKFGLTDVQGTPQQFSGPNSSAATDLGSLVGSAQGILNDRQQSAADALRQQADQASARQSPPQQQSQSNPEPNPNSNNPDEMSNQSARQQSNDDPSQSVIGDISDQKPSTSQEHPDDKSEPPSTDSKNEPPEIPDLSSIHDATSEYVNTQIKNLETDFPDPEIRQKAIDDLINNKFTPYERELYKNTQARDEFEKKYGDLKDSQNDSDREEYNSRKQNLENHLRTNLDNKILSDDDIRSSFGEHLNTRFDPNHPGSIASAMSPQEADVVKNWHSSLISNSNKHERPPAANVDLTGGGESKPTPAPTPEPSPNPPSTPERSPNPPSNSQSAPETPPNPPSTPEPTPTTNPTPNPQSIPEPTPTPTDDTPPVGRSREDLANRREIYKRALRSGVLEFPNRNPGANTFAATRRGVVGKLPTNSHQIKDKLAEFNTNGQFDDDIAALSNNFKSKSESLLQILKNSSLFMDDESDTYVYSEEPEDKSDTKKDDKIDNSNNRSNKRFVLSKILLAGGITALGAGAIHQLSKGAKFNASEFAKHGDIKNANKYMARKNMLSSVDVIDHVKNLVKKYKSNDN